MDPYLGEIKLWPIARVPLGWMPCDGRLLNITEYDALYSLIGDMYGGDGMQTFALPDYRGRVPVGQGNGQGLSPRAIGQTGGQEVVTLTVAQIPAHNHAIQATPIPATTNVPSPDVVLGKGLADRNNADKTKRRDDTFYSDVADSSVSAKLQLGADQLAMTGSSQPHNNRMPSQAVNYIIAVEGIYPPRP